VRAGFQTGPRWAWKISESHRRVASARAEAGRDARHEPARAISPASSIHEDDDDALNLFEFAPPRLIADAHARAPCGCAGGGKAVTADHPGGRSFRSRRALCRLLTSRFLLVSSSYSRRPMLPSSTNNVRLHPHRVSTCLALQHAHCAIGTANPQLKQLAAITQVPLTPVLTYR
jgi:hypothetical protein